MPKIRIDAVQCTTPDEIDKDEMYLMQKGKKLWPKGDLYHRVDTGDMVQVGIDLDLPEGWNEIELWDYDFVSYNDKLGLFKFQVDGNPGKYSTTMQVLEKKSTASYVLYWQILEEDG